ncbi:hypothetical protein LCGC14_1418960 [marine sediment metagenome]|uniref:DNA methylase N-4/N-6 domain-containing protein n=1 Tax=marine sediment metagenome TaxID=412755 RepID=A0A0F9JRS3_9ZZZZ
MSLPKPYYQDEWVTIYLGDCREILPELPNGMVVTDPPYNIDYHYLNYKDNLDDKEYHHLLEVSCRCPSVIIHYPEYLFRLSWLLEEIPRKVIAWCYNSNTARQWRGIGWFGTTQPDFSSIKQEYKNKSDKRIKKLIKEGKRARLYDWWEINQVKNVSVEKTEHPCQIPQEIIRRILVSTPNEFIIDPFLGSGTTLYCAKKLNRKCIGIEIEEKYCEIAAKRCSQQVFDFEEMTNGH